MAGSPGVVCSKPQLRDEQSHLRSDIRIELASNQTLEQVCVPQCARDTSPASASARTNETAYRALSGSSAAR